MSTAAWVCLAAHVIAMLGPFRPAFLGQGRWRFWVPASVVGWLGYYIAANVLRPEDPAWGPAAVGVLVGLGCGISAKRSLDQELKQ